MGGELHGGVEAVGVDCVVGVGGGEMSGDVCW